MKTFIGIDQSLTSTGLVIASENMEVESTSTIKTGTLRGVERLDRIVAAIRGSLISVPPDNEVVIVREGYSYGSKSSCLFDLGELGGCINLEMYRTSAGWLGMHMYEIPPNTWKKFIFGKGDTQKDTQYMMKAYKVTGKEFEDDNQADAYMMLMAFREMCFPDKFPFDKLTIDQKMASLSASVRKKMKITDRNIGKLEEGSYILFAKASIEQYRIF